MEDVFDLYTVRYDPGRPVVGFDERPLQLLDDTREPVASAPRRARRIDYEYRRNGTGNVFTTVEPLAGWRHVEVTERRTAVDFAHQMKWLVDEAYPDAKVIRVVLDNLNIHTAASLYATFPAPEARRIARKLEFHLTPKHGSWLKRGGKRIGSRVHPVPQSTAAHASYRAQGGCGLGAATQFRASEDPLAVHDRTGSQEAAARLSHPGVFTLVVRW
jgi:hypothetical protein